MISNKIQTALFGGVGFRNSTLPEYAIVNEDNQKSESGLYFQDGSELVTIQNIKDSQPNADISEEDFNNLLSNMQRSVILDVVNKVIQGQSDFIASTNLFPFEKTFDTFEVKKGKFVGYEIKKLGYYAKIPFVELSFDGDATFDLCLYNSNLKEPIETLQVTTSAGESKVIPLDWELTDDENYKGGTFYLGYIDDFEAKACKRDYQSSSVKVNTPYFNVWSVNMSTDLNKRTKVYDSDSHGLNFGLDVYNDYTELVIRNKSLFWTVIQLQMHQKVLSMIKYSVRNNYIQDKNMMNVKFADLELHGNKELGVVGINDKLQKAIEHIQKALFYKPRIQRRTLR